MSRKKSFDNDILDMFDKVSKLNLIVEALICCIVAIFVISTPFVKEEF